LTSIALIIDQSKQKREDVVLQACPNVMPRLNKRSDELGRLILLVAVTQ